MSAADAVSHLYLGQVQELCVASCLLASDGVLDERRIRHVRRREAQGDIGPRRAVLRRSARFGGFLPFGEFLDFCFVVGDEFSAYGIYDLCELTFVAAGIGHEISHHAAHFLACVVRIVE